MFAHRWECRAICRPSKLRPLINPSSPSRASHSPLNRTWSSFWTVTRSRVRRTRWRLILSPKVRQALALWSRTIREQRESTTWQSHQPCRPWLKCRTPWSTRTRLIQSLLVRRSCRAISSPQSRWSETLNKKTLEPPSRRTPKTLTTFRTAPSKKKLSNFHHSLWVLTDESQVSGSSPRSLVLSSKARSKRLSFRSREASKTYTVAAQIRRLTPCRMTITIKRLSVIKISWWSRKYSELVSARRRTFWLLQVKKRSRLMFDGVWEVAMDNKVP